MEPGKLKCPDAQQRTLKTFDPRRWRGIATADSVELTLRPAQPDTGIVFRRVDLPQPVDIPINAEAVTDTRLASTISVAVPRCTRSSI